MRTTVGQLMVNDVLPARYRDYGRTLDRKGMKDLALRISQDDPDAYREVMYKLHRIGGDVAHATGGSFRPSDMRPDPITRKQLDSVRARVRALVNDDTLDDDQRAEAIQNVVLGSIEPIEKSLYDEGLKNNNVLALQVHSGSRGKKADIRAIAAGEFMVADHKNRVIPIPILRGYSEGLSPAEMWAASYGTRKGQAATKLLVADAGYFSKKIMQASHRQVVTEPDCRTEAGIPVDAQDPDNAGAVLARSAGGIPAGTIIDAEVMRKLGDAKILVRSPMTCSAINGVCAHCAGIRERGTFPEVGDNIGITAAQAIGEKVSQGTLGCLAAGTLVRMADWTTKAIEDVRAGDLVVAVSRDGRTFPTPVVRVFDSGTKECVQYTFRQSKSQKHFFQLTCTPDHKFLAVTEASRCSAEQFNHVRRILPIGTRRARISAASPAYTTSEWGAVSEPRALLLGLLLGDGCYTKSVRSVNFSCADPELIAHTRDYLETMNLKLSFHRGSQCYWRVSMLHDESRQDPTTGRMLAGSRNPAKQMLEEFGGYGRYSYEKELPAVCFKWDNASIAALLAGLWATDGCVMEANGQPAVSYASTSLRMVEQVRDLLAWRFCVYGTINPNRSSRKRTLYSLNIHAWDDVQKFAAAIPVPGVKRGRLEAVRAHKFKPKVRTIGPRHHAIEARHPVGFVPTYDIEIATEDHLFLLANDVVVSNSKHGGGRATKDTNAERLGGLPLLTQFIDLPSEFRDAATLSQLDGEVDRIEDAPQGGKIVTIDGEDHYVPAGFGVQVKVGQVVQRGQQLSEGWINPVETTQMKGLGAARLQLVQSYRDALKANGVQANRRNLEVIARGLLNHVRVTDLDGTEGLPGDVTEYGDLSRTYRPRYGFRQVPARKSVGMYLEKPALYHTIGTKVTKDIADELEEFGVKDVVAHDDPPPFEPVAVRAMETSMRSPDWQVRFGGSYLQKGLLEAAQRGRDSDAHGTSFVPPLMKAVDFGKDLRTKGVY